MADASDFEEDGAYEGLSFKTIPDDEALDAYSCRACDPDGIPHWRPDSSMAGWLPSESLDAYGSTEFDLGGSTFYRIMDIDDLLDGLRSVGAVCERDDRLVDAAFNGR